MRIEKCGTSLCGYLLNETTNATGETVLSNMKAKTGTQWAGDIYSRASGNTYYAKMTFKQPDTLRVEACAIGRFFCSGNDWMRVARSDEVATSRSLPASPSPEMKMPGGGETAGRDLSGIDVSVSRTRQARWRRRRRTRHTRSPHSAC